MKKSTKRNYDSTSRQREAAKTRQRILTSAKRLFDTMGFENVTIEQLAKQAKVAAPTVYALFKSKRGILLALIDEAFPSEERKMLVEKTRTATSAEEMLELAAHIARKLYEAEKNQLELLHGARTLHPELKKITAKQEKRRYKRLAAAIQVITKDKKFTKDLSPTHAHDTLWALTGRDIYRLFVLERGWSNENYEQWLAQTLKKIFLGTYL